MNRLQRAGRVLLFPLPPVTFERDTGINGDADDTDTFEVNYSDAIGGSFDCKNGKVVNYSMAYPWSDFIEDDGTRLDISKMKTFIVSAAFYALTGKPAHDVVKAAAAALETSAPTWYDNPGEVRVTKDFIASMTTSSIIIDIRN